MCRRGDCRVERLVKRSLQHLYNVRLGRGCGAGVERGELGDKQIVLGDDLLLRQPARDVRQQRLIGVAQQVIGDRQNQRIVLDFVGNLAKCRLVILRNLSHLVNLGKALVRRGIYHTRAGQERYILDRKQVGQRHQRAAQLVNAGLDVLRYQQAAVCLDTLGHGTGVFGCHGTAQNVCVGLKGCTLAACLGADALRKGMHALAAVDRLCRRRIGAAGRYAFRLCRYILLGFHDCLYAGNLRVNGGVLCQSGVKCGLVACRIRLSHAIYNAALLCEQVKQFLLHRSCLLNCCCRLSGHAMVTGKMRSVIEPRILTFAVR